MLYTMGQVPMVQNLLDLRLLVFIFMTLTLFFGIICSSFKFSYIELNMQRWWDYTGFYMPLSRAVFWLNAFLYRIMCIFFDYCTFSVSKLFRWLSCFLAKRALQEIFRTQFGLRNLVRTVLDIHQKGESEEVNQMLSAKVVQLSRMLCY